MMIRRGSFSPPDFLIFAWRPVICLCVSVPCIETEAAGISGDYYTFFIDILPTSSVREFTYLLGKEIYETLLPRSRKMLKLFIQTLKSIKWKFGFDPVSDLPVFNIELGDIERPEYTLDEIFQYLEHADKRCIVAIDEFQQIAKYPEKNIEALLRTHIQKQMNTNFIFAGSGRHMMQEMFSSATRPFCNSADMMELKAIVPEIYVPFIVGLFEKCKRRIGPADVEKSITCSRGIHISVRSCPIYRKSRRRFFTP